MLTPKSSLYSTFNDPIKVYKNKTNRLVEPTCHRCWVFLNHHNETMTFLTETKLTFQDYLFSISTLDIKTIKTQQFPEEV